MSAIRAFLYAPAGRRTKWLVVLFWLILVVVTGPLAGKLTGAEKNDSSAWLPPAAESTQVLNMVDMTDAAAQAAMKRAIEIDALADLELQAANQLNQSIQNAAPGSAPIIEAQADTWLIRANAYTQAATADLMRLRSVDLANASADIKMGATNTTSLRQALANLLQHQ